MKKKEGVEDIEGILILVKGVSASGEAQYAYAIIPHEKYDAFLAAEAAGTYDLSAFGTILAQGVGEPRPEVQAQMEAKYSANHDFERQIAEAIKAADT